jgi:hypothetical protein
MAAPFEANFVCVRQGRVFSVLSAGEKLSMAFSPCVVWIRVQLPVEPAEFACEVMYTFPLGVPLRSWRILLIC